MEVLRSKLPVLLALVLLPTAASAAPATVTWSDLKPAAEADSPSGASLAENLAGREISIAGYLLPVDRDGDLVYEFLLLPTAGACSHSAPPPANQIVRVALKSPWRLTEIYQPVAVAGLLRPGLETTQLFIVDGPAEIESGYSLARAAVSAIDKVPGGTSVPGANPWKFLKK